jgi:hypothetical protein
MMMMMMMIVIQDSRFQHGDSAVAETNLSGNMFFILHRKAKAVPLHATEEFGGRGGIAHTHSQPRH